MLMQLNSLIALAHASTAAARAMPKTHVAHPGVRHAQRALLLLLLIICCSLEGLEQRLDAVEYACGGQGADDDALWPTNQLVALLAPTELLQLWQLIQQLQGDLLLLIIFSIRAQVLLEV